LPGKESRSRKAIWTIWLSCDGWHFLREDAGDRVAGAVKAFRGEAG
jgi:hypothetical protein